MAQKSQLQKTLEKQQKEQKKIAREEKIRERASAIVSAAQYIGSFRVMDKESEMLLEEILKQYDGNGNNYVNFETRELPRVLQESLDVGYESSMIQMYCHGEITGNK